MSHETSSPFLRSQAHATARGRATALLDRLMSTAKAALWFRTHLLPSPPATSTWRKFLGAGDPPMPLRHLLTLLCRLDDLGERETVQSLLQVVAHAFRLDVVPRDFTPREATSEELMLGGSLALFDLVTAFRDASSDGHFSDHEAMQIALRAVDVKALADSLVHYAQSHQHPEAE